MDDSIGCSNKCTITPWLQTCAHIASVIYHSCYTLIRWQGAPVAIKIMQTLGPVGADGTVESFMQEVKVP